MCGITGVVNVPSVTKDDVWKMVHCIQYRGVDERGVEALGAATLGHVRLAVVDPENGMQPMFNEDGSIWVVFNGEIYNFVELREQLKAKGHTFKSRCDTEVLVHLYEEKGIDMLHDLVGMFAFFIWDKNKGEGFLARDRQGIKPAFYAPYKGGVAFCSEIKGLLALPGFDKRVNERALGNVFTFNYCPPPETCFAGVKHLPPGSYMRIDAKGAHAPQTYWKWPFEQERETPTFEAFEAMLDDAIRMQMRFDVDGGIFLSGGLDSSVVSSRLVRQWNRPQLDAIGLRIEENGFSEFEYAQRVAKDLNMNLEALDVRAQDIADIAEKVVFHAEQPHGDFSFFLFYMLARKAHERGKIVMFNGDGPDEVMLGFRHNEAFFGSMTRANFSLRNYFDVISYATERDRQRIMSSSFLPETAHALGRFEEILAPWSDLEPAEQVAAYEVSSLMPGNNTVKGDRMGACWSVEGRGPLMDHRITDMFARLPITDKYKNGIGKHYLKQIGARYFDHDFVFRPKTMPTLPIGEWIKGPLHGWAQSVLDLPDGGRFNNAALQAMLKEHTQGAANHTKQLRTVLMTKLWLKTFFA